MRTLFGYIKSAAPYLLAIWVVIILVLSSIPKVPEIRIDTGRLEIKIDYILHFGEYFALAVLALLTFARDAVSLKTRRVIILLISLLIFGALDESHQMLIPERSFNMSDMASNFAGIVTGLLATLRLNRV